METKLKVLGRWLIVNRCWSMGEACRCGQEAYRAPDPDLLVELHGELAKLQLDMPILPIQGQSIPLAIARLLVQQRAAQRLRYRLDHSNLVEVWGGVSERRRRLMSQAAKKPPIGDSIAS